VSLVLEAGGHRLVLERPSNLEDDGYQARGGGDAKPYWAFLWASAHALARAILEGPDLTGRRIIEIGAGLGLSGLAAAMRGAHVVSTDIRPEAVRLVAENAARNGLALEARVVDFFAPPADLGLYDGVLAADVIYNDGMLAGVMRFMRAHLAPGGLGCLTDPYRIMPVGVQGAARINGLEVAAQPLASPGPPVLMYVLQRRPSALMVADPSGGVAEAPVPPSRGRRATPKVGAKPKPKRRAEAAGKASAPRAKPSPGRPKKPSGGGRAARSARPK
jgi:predicted nicotinamide N-methyase